MYRLLLLLATLVGTIFYQFSQVYSANCAAYDEKTECEEQTECLWSNSGSYCYCASDVTMDICFALDSSGSIGEEYFEIELEWFADFVQSGLSTNARVGIINFSRYVYTLLNFEESESYTTAELVDFILNDIPYYDSYTNTVDAIEHALDMFEDYSSDEATKVFVIMTDGNPKMPNNGDENVCQWENDLKSNDINTYILGVGDNWDEEKVDCLVGDVTTDIVYVTSFNYSAFDKILPELTDITCPEDYEVVITEVKVESDGTDFTVPFVEFYNPSFDIELADIEFSGDVVEGAPTNGDAVLPQGYYLVVYDGTYATTGGENNVTCEECDCVLRDNMRFCEGAIYIGCDDNPCEFKDFTNTGWTVTIEDSTSDPAIVLDTVVYDSTFPDLSDDDLIGLSYELKNRGYDNDQGSNWQPSCNVFGTPGAPPIENCTQVCSAVLCMANGAKNVTAVGDVCDCDREPHYYENGCACELVPPPDNCINYWRKNYTSGARDWYFVWDAAPTDETHTYELCYPVKDSTVQCTELGGRFKSTLDFDYVDYLPGDYQGDVKTLMNGAYSVSVNCTATTFDPTPAPFPVPSSNPTIKPTKLPTTSPTFADPRIFIGGDICGGIDRCDCNGRVLSCVGDEVQIKWSEGTQYVRVQQRDKDFPYNTDVYWYLEYLGSSNVTVESDDSTLVTRRRLPGFGSFSQKVNMNKAGFFDVNKGRVLLSNMSTTASGGSDSTDGSSEMNDTSGDSSSGDGGDASTYITPTSGYITVGIKYTDDTQTDISENEGIIEFEVLDNDIDETQEFRLTLVNCSIDSVDYRDCSIIYPSELFIYLQSTTGANTSVDEEPMPDWLWWLIAGLVVFLMVLAWLVYRYWWKNKANNAALATTQDDIDQAIKEIDEGIGHGLGQGDVAFNPMATGGMGQRPMDTTTADIEKRQSAMMNERADVGVEKFGHRQDMGQVQAQRHGN